MMNEEREKAKALLTKEAEAGENPDYDQLHQGEEGTALRHNAVMGLMTGDLVEPPSVLVDFGCGTALLLKSMHDKGMIMPERYIGVDFLDIRRELVEERIEKYVEGKGVFICSDSVDEVAAGMDRQNLKKAMIVSIGIMGYRGLHTLRHIRGQFETMARCFSRGIVTVPRQLPERLGEADMARYDPDDLYNHLPANKFRTRSIHTDTLVYWG